MSEESPEARLTGWLSRLETRHLADLTQSEVTRALRALSSCYVERRDRLSAGAALEGAGKRAAFALFYGPHHFLVAREIVRGLRDTGALQKPLTSVVDLGCGTGAAGAAVALELAVRSIAGIDISRWAVAEAGWTYRVFHLQGRARAGNLKDVRLDGAPGELILAAYAVNELPDAVREALWPRLLQSRAAGSSILIIEPIARRVNRWWPQWAAAAVSHGGREDEWRFHLPLPPRQRVLAKGAGLDVRELTARSLWLAASDQSLSS